MATTGVQQATLMVWKFPTATGAAEAVKTVKTLQREQLINLLDAAIVSWSEKKLAASMSDMGISDDFIRRVGSEVTPGTSPLFTYTSGAIVDKVPAAFAEEAG